MVEEIAVTGIWQFLNHYKTPAVTIKKTGDFLVQRASRAHRAGYGG